MKHEIKNILTLTKEEQEIIRDFAEITELMCNHIQNHCLGEMCPFFYICNYTICNYTNDSDDFFSDFGSVWEDNFNIEIKFE